MTIYDDFAYFYTNGHYPSFSARLVELLPVLLDEFDAQPRTVLDLACGEGTFAVALAKKGYRVTGVDRSPQMLAFATERALKEQVEIDLIEKDMRELEYDGEFELVTCWYDSLNYLLELEDLRRCFTGVFRALKPSGLFIFDMLTIYGLAVNWQRRECYIEQETDELIEFHLPNHDHKQNIAAMRIIGFRRVGSGASADGEHWCRMEEVHYEKGYTLKQIREALADAGLTELACYGHLRERRMPTPVSGRVWCVGRRD